MSTRVRIQEGILCLDIQHQLAIDKALHFALTCIRLHRLCKQLRIEAVVENDTTCPLVLPEVSLGRNVRIRIQVERSLRSRSIHRRRRG